MHFQDTRYEISSNLPSDDLHYFLKILHTEHIDELVFQPLQSFNTLWFNSKDVYVYI